MTYDSYLNPYQIFSGFGAARVGFLGTLAFGALCLGAPVYACLAHYRKVRWYTALALGIIFGALCFTVSKEIGLVAMLLGGMVALVTHWATLRWMSPNSSSKTRPLNSGVRRR